MNQINDDVKIYPNPTDGMIHIEYEGEYAMQVFNLIGEKVFENIDLSNNQVVNLSVLNRGMYVVSIQDSQREFAHRLLMR